MYSIKPYLLHPYAAANLVYPTTLIVKLHASFECFEVHPLESKPSVVALWARAGAILTGSGVRHCKHEEGTVRTQAKWCSQTGCDTRQPLLRLLPQPALLPLRLLLPLLSLPLLLFLLSYSVCTGRVAHLCTFLCAWCCCCTHAVTVVNRPLM